MPGPRILEWYRADPWRESRRVLLVGPAVLTLGGGVMAISFLMRPSFEVRLIAVTVGFALILAGAAFTLAAMHGRLRREVSLVLRTDGVFVQSARSELLVPWEDLRAVRWDEKAGALVLERSEGEPVVVPRPPARIGGPELVARLLQQKRRAALKLPS